MYNGKAGLDPWTHGLGPVQSYFSIIPVFMCRDKENVIILKSRFKVSQ